METTRRFIYRPISIHFVFQGIGNHFVPYINNTWQRRGSLWEGQQGPIGLQITIDRLSERLDGSERPLVPRGNLLKVSVSATPIAFLRASHLQRSGIFS